jgi:type II secretory pathway pseudopilin PulG
MGLRKYHSQQTKTAGMTLIELMVLVALTGVGAHLLSAALVKRGKKALQQKPGAAAALQLSQQQQPDYTDWANRPENIRQINQLLKDAAQQHLGKKLEDLSDHEWEKAFQIADAQMRARFGNLPKEKTASLCASIAGTINPSDFARFEKIFEEEAVQQILPKTASVVGALTDLLSRPMVSGEDMLRKAASFQRERTDVVQIRPHGYGYLLKWGAAPDGAAPKEEKVSKEQAQQVLPQQMLDTADEQGVATVTDVPAEPDPLIETPQPIQGFGVYKVYEAGTGKQFIGFCIPNLFDPMQGVNTPMHLWFNGGQFALQPEINGVMVALSYNLPESMEARGMGVFYKTNGRGIIATVPYNVLTKVTVEGREYYSATTQEGQEIQIVMSEGLQKPIATSPQELAIPADYSFLALDGQVQLDGMQEQPAAPGAVPGDPTGGPAMDPAAQGGAQPPKMQKVQLNGGAGTQGQPAQDPMAQAKKAAAYSMCEIRAWRNEMGPGGGVQLSGPVFEKVGSGVYDWADGIFWLAAAGMPQNLSLACIDKAASAGEVVRMYGLQQLSPHSPGMLKDAAADAVAAMVGKHIPERPCLLKEALALGHNKEARTLVGTDAIDSLLALNFLNPENVQTFVDHIPHLEATSSKLAGLVFATQLGLQSVPKHAAIRAMECLEGVISGLKALQDYKL